VRRPSLTNPPGDESCLSQRDLGLYRDPTERNSTAGTAVMPRGSILVGPFADLTFSGAVGTGIRSIDPQFITQNLQTPFAKIFSWEGGASFQHRFAETFDTSARAVVFGTRVDKDLVFNAQEGRGIIGGATSRLGALATARVRHSWFDISGNVTWVRSTFDDTKLLVPYVPDFVARVDAAVFHELPWEILNSAIKGKAGFGLTYVGRRALPYGQRSDVIFVMDASAELEWKIISLGFSVTNLAGAKYKQVELNYANDFHTSGSQPSLVPAHMFAAGAPRAFMATLGLHFGGEE
jgi:iron complex outermembrane receptor protein